MSGTIYLILSRLMSTFSGVFNGPDIRYIMADDLFHSELDPEEKVAWDALCDVIRECLAVERQGNAYCRQKCCAMLAAFRMIGVKMNLKLHFLHYHMDQFLAQLSTESDEHGEKFHQTSAPFERFFKGKKLNHLLAEISWHMMQEEEEYDD